MIHLDGTMDVIAHGKPERRRYTTFQRVTRGCITQNIFDPVLEKDEVVIYHGKEPPEILWKKKSP